MVEEPWGETSRLMGHIVHTWGPLDVADLLEGELVLVGINRDLIGIDTNPKLWSALPLAKARFHPVRKKKNGYGRIKFVCEAGGGGGAHNDLSLGAGQ